MKIHKFSILYTDTLDKPPYELSTLVEHFLNYHEGNKDFLGFEVQSITINNSSCYIHWIYWDDKE